MDPNLQRLGNREITVTGSHQVTSRVSVTAGWYHRTYQDLQQLDRTLIATSRLHIVHDSDARRVARCHACRHHPERFADGLQSERRQTVGVQFASSRQERRRSVHLQRLRSVVQRTASGRQHALRQLDDRAKRVGLLLDRRQSERTTDRRSVYRRVGRQRRPLLRSAEFRHSVRTRVQTGRAATRSPMSASTSASSCRAMRDWRARSLTSRPQICSRAGARTPRRSS